MGKINIKNNETAVYAIGGLNEIGKNTYGIQFHFQPFFIPRILSKSAVHPGLLYCLQNQVFTFWGNPVYFPAEIEKASWFQMPCLPI